MLGVENGWLESSEINTVQYEPEQVTIEQLESWLKNSGTYIRTVPKKKE